MWAQFLAHKMTLLERGTKVLDCMLILQQKILLNLPEEPSEIFHF